MTRVLVFTPTFEKGGGSLALRRETEASVKALRFSGEWDWVVSDHNPFGPQAGRNVLAQYERGRELALDGGYDGLLTVEHDMVIPPDALEKLWESPADVVYGVYMLRHGARCVNAFRWDNNVNIGMSLSRYPDELRRAQAFGMVRVSGAGFGCTLIRRRVLERIPFRPAGPDSWIPDMPFAQDCLRANIESVARFDVACGHYDGEVLLLADGEYVMDLVKVIANFDVVALVQGNSQALKAGYEYELPYEVASELNRAGYVFFVEQGSRGAGGQRSRGAGERVEAAALEGGERAVKGAPRRKKKGDSL